VLKLFLIAIPSSTRLFLSSALEYLNTKCYFKLDKNQNLVKISVLYILKIQNHIFVLFFFLLDRFDITKYIRIIDIVWISKKIK